MWCSFSSPTLETPPVVPDEIQDLVRSVVILPQSTDLGVSALVDSKEYVYKHHDVHRAKYVVVRPDGVIGEERRELTAIFLESLLVTRRPFGPACAARARPQDRTIEMVSKDKRVYIDAMNWNC